MKGVILSINPDAIIVDISHDIAPQDIQQGALILANSVNYFPRDAIHICVVDPGVGSSRRPIAVQAGETFFVGPDNGVLSWAMEAVQGSTRAVHLTNAHYFLPRVSNTFHGRDIFSPVAAHLSRGVPLDALGEEISDWIKLPAPQAQTRADDALVGQVIYIDKFGNLVLNLTEEQITSTNYIVEIAGRAIRGLARTFADRAEGELLACIGSSGHLDIAVRNGNAARELGVKVGEEVVVRKLGGWVVG
jgi:S-adenosylmethionine hydrolase